MDFIVSQPGSHGGSGIWVIVNQFTKMAIKTQLPIQDLARTFLQQTWRLHGLPEGIISDRHSSLEGRFWASCRNLLNMDVRMSLAYHPQSNSHTEKVNQTLEHYVRNYCSYQQDDWFGLVPMAEHT